jgi:hypothetical protein
MQHSYPRIAAPVYVAIYTYLLSGIFLLSKPKTMKRKQILLLSLLSSSIVYGQIGVNTESPKSTFHVIPTKTDGSTAEGFIAPNLTRSQLISKDNKYTAAEEGTMVYITTLDGTVTSKTSKVTTVGYYYYDGKIWQQFATSAGGSIPSEPWRVQGTTTEATNNTDNIYQQGTVAIGSNTSNGYTFQVTGGSNITSNSRVGSSTVVGAQSVGSTLSVGGNTTIGKAAAGTTPASGDLLVMGRTSIGHTKIENDKSLYVKGITLLDGVTQVGTSLNNTSLTVQGSLEVKGGSFKLNGNGAGVGKYLVSDANGKGTWSALPAATVTTANNGLSMSGTTTQLGGALAKATTISGTAANTLTISAPAIVSGSLRISSGTPGSNKYLKSDALGNAVWSALPAATVTTADNGLSMSGTTTQLGGALAKATTISGTAANTLTLSVPTRIGTSTALFNSSAQLELADANKGFLPNRVALTSSTVKAPVTNAVDGMMVYNTATVAAESLAPGFYYWRGTSWQRLVDKIPVTGVRMFYQTASVVAGPASGGDQSKMKSLSFSETGKVHVPVVLKLPEDGSYAFNVKLYSQVCNLSTGAIAIPKYAGKIVVYVGIWVNNVLQDVSEVFYQVSPMATGTVPLNGANLTNVVLGCTGVAGDKIDIRLGYLTGSVTATEAILSQGSVNPTPISNRTSLVFWKL